MGECEEDPKGSAPQLWGGAPPNVGPGLIRDAPKRHSEADRHRDRVTGRKCFLQRLIESPIQFWPGVLVPAWRLLVPFRTGKPTRVGPELRIALRRFEMLHSFVLSVMSASHPLLWINPEPTFWVIALGGILRGRREPVFAQCSVFAERLARDAGAAQAHRIKTDVALTGDGSARTAGQDARSL